LWKVLLTEVRFETLAVPRYEDYDIEYQDRNMWAWLGNGFSTRDYDGKDTTWFWGLVDGKDEGEPYGPYKSEVSGSNE
jgi:hypothetical protein